MTAGVRVMVVGAVLGACGVPVRDAPPDAAAPDAAVPEPASLPEPIELTGTTPAGPADLHYIYAWYGSAWCGYGYRILLTRTEDLWFTNDPYLEIELPAPEEATAAMTGPLAATARLMQRPTATSDVVFLGRADFTFDAETVEPPSGQPILGSPVGW